MNDLHLNFQCALRTYSCPRSGNHSNTRFASNVSNKFCAGSVFNFKGHFANLCAKAVQNNDKELSKYLNVPRKCIPVC